MSQMTQRWCWAGSARLCLMGFMSVCVHLPWMAPSQRPRLSSGSAVAKWSLAQSTAFHHIYQKRYEGHISARTCLHRKAGIGSAELSTGSWHPKVDDASLVFKHLSWKLEMTGFACRNFEGNALDIDSIFQDTYQDTYHVNIILFSKPSSRNS